MFRIGRSSATVTGAIDALAGASAPAPGKGCDVDEVTITPSSATPATPAASAAGTSQAGRQKRGERGRSRFVSGSGTGRAGTRMLAEASRRRNTGA